MIVRPIRRVGLTLIELVVVLAILAALASLLIPKVDFLKGSADKAAAAAGIEGVAGNLQLYRTVKGKFPAQFDSLIITGTTNRIATFHPVNEMTVVTVPADTASVQTQFSLWHMGITSVMDHLDPATNPAVLRCDSGTVQRVIAGPPTFTTSDQSLVSLTANGGIERAIYPGPNSSTSSKPAEVTLICLGVGPACTANGVTMSNTPLYAGVDAETTYGRYIAVFAAHANGKPAELKAVLDPLGNVQSTALTGYFKSLPD